MEPWRVPRDFYDQIRERADGSDVTDLFDIDDPQWQVMRAVLFKTDDGELLLSVLSTLALEPDEEER